MNNRIELLLQGRLAPDTKGSINKQIQDLQKQLDTLEIDSRILEDLKELQRLKIENSGIQQLAESLKKSQEEAKNLKKQLNEVNDEVEKKKPKITAEFDDKAVKYSLKQLEEMVKQRGGKLSYDIDTTGAEDRIKTLTATFEKFGKKRTEVFKPLDETGDMWGMANLKKHESKVKETNEAYKRLKETLESSQRDAKITTDQFDSMSKKLEKFRTSKKHIDGLAESLKSLETSNKYTDQLVRSMEKLVATGRMSESQMKEQLRVMNTMGDLNKTKYDNLRHAIDLVTISNKKRTKAIQDEEKATEERYKAEEKLQRLQNRFIHLTQYKPKVQELDGFDELSSNMKSMTFNRALMSTEELQQAIKETSLEIQRMSARATEAGRTQIGMVNAFKQALEKFPVWVATSTMFYGSIRSARKFMEIIVDIDTKMTELRKVMADGTDYDAVFDRATESAERFGQTISDTMDAYTEFARQGYEEEELGFLADTAVVASNVTESTTEEAAGFITAALIQWNKGAEDAMLLLDQWNELSNNYAVTASQVMEAQAKSGSVAQTMGMDLEQSNAALATVIASTKQSGSEIG